MNLPLSPHHLTAAKKMFDLSRRKSKYGWHYHFSKLDQPGNRESKNSCICEDSGKNPAGFLEGQLFLLLRK